MLETKRDGALYAICSAFVCLLVGPSSHAATATGPWLPKTVATKSICIVDLSKERGLTVTGHNLEISDVYLSVVALQGIVNQESSDKVYLTNGPSSFGDQGGWKTDAIDTMALEDGLLPVPQRTAKLDGSKRWPALSYLMGTYGTKISGVVLIPKVENKTTPLASAQIAAAITMAGVTHALPVTQDVLTQLESEGFHPKVVEDTRTLKSPVSAFLWSKERFFDKTNRLVAGINRGGGAIFSRTRLDYLIATRTFCFDLSGYDNYYYVRDVIKAYPPGCALLGDDEYHAELKAYTHLGACHIIFLGENFSVHSGFSVPASAMPAVRPPKALPIDPKGAYISFFVTDGDSSWMNNYGHWLGQKLHPAQFGKDPVGWSFSNSLVDAYPQLCVHRANQVRELDGTYEIVASPYDGIFPEGQAAQDNFVAHYRAHIAQTGNLFNTLNTFGWWTDPQVSRSGVRGVLLGYGGKEGGNDILWAPVNGGDVVTQVFSGATQGGCNAAEMLTATKRAVDNAQEGKPLFATICAGDGCVHLAAPGKQREGDNDPLGWAESVINQTAPNHYGGRNFYYLLPKDVLETWKYRNAWTIGAPATASSSAVGHGPEKAVDGLAEDYWSPAAGTRNQLTVNLPAPKPIGEVIVKWGKVRPASFTIKVQDEQSKWVPIPVPSGGKDVLEIAFPEINANSIVLECQAAKGAQPQVRQLTGMAVDRSLLDGAMLKVRPDVDKAVAGTAPGNYPVQVLEKTRGSLDRAAAAMKAPAITQRELDTLTEEVYRAKRTLDSGRLMDPATVAKAANDLERLLAVSKWDVGGDASEFRPDAADKAEREVATVRQAVKAAGADLDVTQTKDLQSRLDWAQTAYLTSANADIAANDPLNLAFGKPVTVSDIATGFKATSITDGNEATLYKSSSTSKPSTVTLDLQQPAKVALIEMRQPISWARAFTIEASTDGAAWKTIYSTSAGTRASAPLFVDPVDVRYLRFNLKKTEWGEFMISELIVREAVPAKLGKP
ncbi:MAG TPA: discoidin domain-containing protein [Capsulimonadaceae bacterium]|jgi:hypothetical protein